MSSDIFLGILLMLALFWLQFDGVSSKQLPNNPSTCPKGYYRYLSCSQTSMLYSHSYSQYYSLSADTSGSYSANSFPYSNSYSQYYSFGTDRFGSYSTNSFSSEYSLSHTASYSADISSSYSEGGSHSYSMYYMSDSGFAFSGAEYSSSDQYKADKAEVNSRDCTTQPCGLHRILREHTLDYSTSMYTMSALGIAYSGADFRSASEAGNSYSYSMSTSHFSGLHSGADYSSSMSMPGSNSYSMPTSGFSGLHSGADYSSSMSMLGSNSYSMSFSSYSYSAADTNCEATCVRCSRGYTTASADAVSIHDCDVCTSGFYGNLHGRGDGSGNSGCVACDAHASDCSPKSAGHCDAGYVASETGFPCIACDVGKYKAGNSSCVDCDAHASDCSPKSAGHCDAGYAASETGFPCIACDAGMYKADNSNSVCISCPEGKTSAKGASICYIVQELTIPLVWLASPAHMKVELSSCYKHLIVQANLIDFSASRSIEDHYLVIRD